MTPIIEAWEAIRAFIDAGGTVLLAIFGVTLLMWTLILERQVYFRLGHRKEVERVSSLWRERRDQKSWTARQIRQLLISQVSTQLRHSLLMIKTLVAVCPLLGLLGTVTGMIEVFDVMAIAGNGDPRAMAGGVTRATVPTMAGMVAALSGMYFSVQLQRFADDEVEKLADELTAA